MGLHPMATPQALAAEGPVPPIPFAAPVTPVDLLIVSTIVIG